MAYRVTPNDCKGCLAGTSNDNHEPGKCCLRCRNFNAADEQAWDWPMERLWDDIDDEFQDWQQKNKDLWTKLAEGDRATTEKAIKLKSAATHITGSLQTDLDRYRALFTWITNNIKYKEESAANFDPLTVLNTGKCVCRGFANLYSSLASIINLHCGFVPGKGKVPNFKDFYSSAQALATDNVNADHAWNEIFIRLYPGDQGSYKLVDTTWGSNGEIGTGLQVTGPQTNLNFFSMSNDEFFMDHFPSKELDAALAGSFAPTPGGSLPIYSHLRPINGGHVEANYMQWSTAEAPPFLQNTDSIDLIDRETIKPRTRYFNPHLITVLQKPAGQSFNRAQGQNLDARIYGVDPMLLNNVDAADVPVAVFAAKIACLHRTDVNPQMQQFYVLARYKDSSEHKIFLRLNGKPRLICTESLVRADDKKSILLYCKIRDTPVAIWDVEAPLANSNNNGAANEHIGTTNNTSAANAVGQNTNNNSTLDELDTLFEDFAIPSEEMSRMLAEFTEDNKESQDAVEDVKKK